MPSTPAAPLLRLTCASAFLRLSRSTIASIDGPTTARLSTSVFAARASVPPTPALRASPVAPACQGDLQLGFLPHGPDEIAVLLAIPPFRPSAGLPAYYALC